MVFGNCEKLVERIVRVSGLNKDEIRNKIESKKEKLSGLISDEGAAQIIAAELGVSFDDEKFKINELSSGMKRVNTIGRIIKLLSVRSFTTKNGDEGKVANLILADETSNIKVVLWDMNHIELIEKGSLGEGKTVEIVNGNMRDNELHLGSFSELKPHDKTFDSVRTEKVVREKHISDFGVSDSVSTRAFVVQAFEPKFFNVCQECGKKAVLDGDNFVCAEHGKVVPEKRILLNIILDDGTESIRSVLFHECLSELGFTELESPDMLSKQKESLLGKEMVFSGNVRMNKFFNDPEFVVNAVKSVDIADLIKQLENN